MATDPKTWRLSAGLSLREIASRAGIGGSNPARTYDRYERGEQTCPPQVIETVRALSDGAIGAEDWQALRVARLNAGQEAAAP